MNTPRLHICPACDTPTRHAAPDGLPICPPCWSLELGFQRLRLLAYNAEQVAEAQALGAVYRQITGATYGPAPRVEGVGFWVEGGPVDGRGEVAPW